MKWQTMLMLCLISTGATAITGTLENPQPDSPQSGIALISGWVCDANQITVSFDGQARIVVPYGSPRLDTATICGRSDTGFGLLTNYNILGPGIHVVTLFADGVVIGSARFTVTTFGTEFLKDAGGGVSLNNFPVFGERTSLVWQQATQNFSINAVDNAVPPIPGLYSGANTGSRTNCAANNGLFVEYSQFSVSVAGSSITIATAPSTTTSCTLRGTLGYFAQGGDYTVQNGTFSCADTSQGTWTSPIFSVTAEGLTGQLTQTFSNGCTVRSRFGGPRT